MFVSYLEPADELIIDEGRISKDDGVCRAPIDRLGKTAQHRLILGLIIGSDAD